jgi:hydrogenase maturation protease
LKAIIIGIGNLLFKDEGIGPLAALLIKANYRFNPPLEVMDGATLGFKLLPYLQEYDHIIILDTVSIEDDPGSIYVLPRKALLELGEYRKTAHEVEVVQMMEMASFLETPSEVTVVGIIPEDIESVAIDLSATLRRKLPELINQTLKTAASLGFEAERVADHSLEAVIETVSSPSTAKEIF